MYCSKGTVGPNALCGIGKTVYDYSGSTMRPAKVPSIKKIFVGNGKSYMEQIKKSQVIMQPFVFMLKNWYKIECTQPPKEVCFKQTVINFTLLIELMVFTYFLSGRMIFA
jgi:hypothetical protein